MLGNCESLTCIMNDTAGCIVGTPEYILNAPANTTDFSSNIQFFEQWLDSDSNPIFNSSDIIGLMSMHSVGGVNLWVNNGLLTSAAPYCGTATITAGG